MQNVAVLSHLRPQSAYILGHYGHARSQGERQPAAAKPGLYISIPRILLEVRLELWLKYGTLYVKKTELEVLTVVDSSAESEFFFGGGGRCNTGGVFPLLFLCVGDINRSPCRRKSGATAAAAVQQRSDVWRALSTLLGSSTCCGHIHMCAGYVLQQ